MGISMNEMLVMFCVIALIIASILGISFFYKDLKKIDEMWEDEPSPKNKKANGK